MPNEGLQQLIEQIIQWWRDLYRQVEQIPPSAPQPNTNPTLVQAIDTLTVALATQHGLDEAVIAFTGFMAESLANPTGFGIAATAFTLNAGDPAVRAALAHYCFMYVFAAGRGLIDVPPPPITGTELFGLDEIRRRQGGGDIRRMFDGPVM